MDNFNLDELMDLAEAYVGPMVDAIYRRLIERDFALEDPEVVMLLTALINILGHDNRGDRPTEVLLMAANEKLRSTKKELDEMTRSMLQMEEDRDMWRKLFEDCNKKQVKRLSA